MTCNYSTWVYSAVSQNASCCRSSTDMALQPLKTKRSISESFFFFFYLYKTLKTRFFHGVFWHQEKHRISPHLSINEDWSSVSVVVPWLYLKHHCRSWYSASWCWAHTACSSSAAAADTVSTSSQWPETPETTLCHWDSNHSWWMMLSSVFSSGSAIQLPLKSIVLHV